MNAIAPIEARQDQLPAAANDSASLLQVISRAASDPNVDIEKMERLLAMHRDMQKQQAETSFNDAMARIQAQMRRIGTDKENKQTNSAYATYGKLDRALRPLYTEEGFALSFGTDEAPLPDMVRVVCHVTHRDGFTRKHMIDMPADGKGAKGNDVMTKTHATGSATQYGMRYLLKMIFNVAIGDDPDDDDGNGANARNAELQAARRKAEHDEAAGIHDESIAFIKERIAAKDLTAVAQEWRAIPRADQIALWLAPTKGGCFTTEERRVIHDELPRPESMT